MDQLQNGWDPPWPPGWSTICLVQIPVVVNISKEDALPSSRRGTSEGNEVYSDQRELNYFTALIRCNKNITKNSNGPAEPPNDSPISLHLLLRTSRAFPRLASFRPLGTLRTGTVTTGRTTTTGRGRAGGGDRSGAAANRVRSRACCPAWTEAYASRTRRTTPWDTCARCTTPSPGGRSGREVHDHEFRTTPRRPAGAGRGNEVFGLTRAQLFYCPN